MEEPKRFEAFAHAFKKLLAEKELRIVRQYGDYLEMGYTSDDLIIAERQPRFDEVFHHEWKTLTMKGDCDLKLKTDLGPDGVPYWYHMGEAKNAVFVVTAHHECSDSFCPRVHKVFANKQDAEAYVAAYGEAYQVQQEPLLQAPDAKDVAFK